MLSLSISSICAFRSRGRLLALALAGRLLGGEVQRHRVAAAVVSGGHAAEDLRAERGPLARVLLHQLPGPVRVAAPALHDLDEAGVVRIADDVDGDVAAVAEGGLPGEQLGGLRPPPVLLGPVAVAAGRLLGLEAGQRDEPAVLGHAGRRAEPAGGTGCQLLDPPVERGTRLPGIGHLSLDHLDEHGCAPFDVARIPGRPIGCPDATTARWPRRHRADDSPGVSRGDRRPRAGTAALRNATGAGRRPDFRRRAVTAGAVVLSLV